MNRTEKIQAIQCKVEADNISLRSIARGTALSINTVRAAVKGEASTTESILNFLCLYLGIKREQERTKKAS